MDVSPRYLPEAWVVPEVTPENKAFFTSGEIRLQTCKDCKTVQHPPVDVCIGCSGFEFDYEPTDPNGVVESYTIVHHPVHEMLKDSVPYNVVVVALDGHPSVRVVGNLLDVPTDGVHIGDRVTASWAVIPATNEHQELKLPQWRAAR